MRVSVRTGAASSDFSSRATSASSKIAASLSLAAIASATEPVSSVWKSGSTSSRGPEEQAETNRQRLTRRTRPPPWMLISDRSIVISAVAQQGSRAHVVDHLSTAMFGAGVKKLLEEV